MSLASIFDEKWFDRARRKLRAHLDNVLFRESIFTLPFAYLGMVLAAHGSTELTTSGSTGLTTGGAPTWWQFFWVTMAMVGARTFGFCMNRLIDLPLDAANPHTAQRPLPRGLLTPKEVWTLAVVSLALLALAAWRLNPLCLQLSPLAAAILALYPYAKRFTWLCHLVLGTILGAAPVGAWIAVTGALAWEPIVVGLAVATWAAGFDIMFHCADAEEDRALNLHSVPVRFGVAPALVTSALFHLATLLLLGLLGLMMALGPLYWIGLAMVAALLLYEHSLVRPNDLSRMGVAFFNLNGSVSIVFFLFTLASLFVLT